MSFNRTDRLAIDHFMWTIKYHKPNFEMPAALLNPVTSMQDTHAHTYMLARTLYLCY